MYKGTEKATNKDWAVKVIDLQKLNMTEVRVHYEYCVLFLILE